MLILAKKKMQNLCFYFYSKFVKSIFKINIPYLELENLLFWTSA